MSIGVNFIFYYGSSFFQGSGISNGFTISLITSCINVASTFPGLYLVEKWGRRNLLLFGAIGMAVCQFSESPPSQPLRISADAVSSRRCYRYCRARLQSTGPAGPRCFRVYIYILFCKQLGPLCMGCDGRNFPPQSPREISFHDHSIQLAPQLGHRLRMFPHVYLIILY